MLSCHWQYKLKSWLCFAWKCFIRCLHTRRLDVIAFYLLIVISSTDFPCTKKNGVFKFFRKVGWFSWKFSLRVFFSRRNNCRCTVVTNKLVFVTLEIEQGHSPARSVLLWHSNFQLNILEKRLCELWCNFCHFYCTFLRLDAGRNDKHCGVDELEAGFSPILK